MNEADAQERLRRHAGRFDLASLLGALRQLGYAWHELRFRSHITTVAETRGPALRRMLGVSSVVRRANTALTA